MLVCLTRLTLPGSQEGGGLFSRGIKWLCLWIWNSKHSGGLKIEKIKGCSSYEIVESSAVLSVLPLECGQPDVHLLPRFLIQSSFPPLSLTPLPCIFGQEITGFFLWINWDDANNMMDHYGTWGCFIKTHLAVPEPSSKVIRNQLPPSGSWKKKSHFYHICFSGYL